MNQSDFQFLKQCIFDEKILLQLEYSNCCKCESQTIKLLKNQYTKDTGNTYFVSLYELFKITLSEYEKRLSDPENELIFKTFEQCRFIFKTTRALNKMGKEKKEKRKSEGGEEVEEKDGKEAWAEKTKYLSPISKPLASRKLTKRLYKVIKKGAYM